MVYVSFGNLTTNQMVERLGVELTNTEIEILEGMRIDNAQDIPKGRWHCFDMPFKIHTGDDVTAQKIIDILMPHNNKMKTQLALESYGK